MAWAYEAPGLSLGILFLDRGRSLKGRLGLRAKQTKGFLGVGECILAPTRAGRLVGPVGYLGPLAPRRLRGEQSLESSP